MDSTSIEKEKEIIKEIERMERITSLIASNFFEIKRKFDDNDLRQLFEKTGNGFKVLSYDLEKIRLFLV